jgi:hypothetical protein
MSGPVVNGGLIDFQDNFHRGMAESYANFMASQQQQALAANSFPIQPYQQAQFAPQPFQPQMGLPAGASSHLPYVTGPPSYLHVNGQTYVPVDAQQPVSVATPKAGSVQPGSVESAPEPARVYTDEDIERRAQEKVDAWAASKLKASQAEVRRHLKGRVPSEADRAAQRIHSVNAGMRGRFTSPL